MTHSPLILAIDSSPMMHFVYQTQMARFSLQLVLAKDAATALTLANQYTNEIGLILIDIVLPDSDGLTLVKQLKQRLSQVPIIVVSSRQCLPEHTTYPSMIADYYSKPLFDNQLKQLLATYKLL